MHDQWKASSRDVPSTQRDQILPWTALPASWRARAFRTPYSVLLESCRPGREQHRSFLFADASSILTLNEGDEPAGFFQAVQRALADGLYVAGYVTYEAGELLQSLPYRRLAGGAPLARFGLYRQVHRFDHLSQQGRAEEEADTFQEGDANTLLDLAMMPAMGRKTYEANIDRIHEWIAAGDTYQVNYTTALQSRFHGDASAAYRRLSLEQQSSFAAAITLDAERTVLSFSPELFFQVDEERNIRMRPMKGTAGRGTAAAADLHASEKNRAEHVMIVDLLRNDLGKVCDTGTVRVPGLFQVETYATLHQMVSTVEGRLRQDADWLAVFRALFPSGSITGAPKRRTMELIHQLEPAPRDVYTGAIGYFAPDGSAAFSVAIRTLLLQHAAASRGATMSMGVGGGIVADSTAADEYAECLLKASFVERASKPLQFIETMRAERGRIAHRERHLARIDASARELGFPCDRRVAEQELDRLLQDHAVQDPRRIRLTLDRSGRWHGEATSFETWPALLRVRVAATQTDASDSALRHKTTARALYDRELRESVAAGFHEAIFSNTAGLLTEGCISNLYVCAGGRVLTPRLADGVLPGVLRAILLETGEVEEAELRLKDLEMADAVLLGNSLRGLHAVGSISLRSGRVARYDPEAAPGVGARL